MTVTPGKAMEAQFRIAKRLKDHGVTLYFMGTPEIPADKCIATRWELIRSTIVDFRLRNAQFGKRADGLMETCQEAYERATGEPLIPAKSEVAA